MKKQIVISVGLLILLPMVSFGSSNANACRELIREKVCFKDINLIDAECFSGSIASEYVPFFENAYDAYPQKIKKFLCDRMNMGLRFKVLPLKGLANSSFEFNKAIFGKQLKVSHPTLPQTMNVVVGPNAAQFTPPVTEGQVTSEYSDYLFLILAQMIAHSLDGVAFPGHFDEVGQVNKQYHALYLRDNATINAFPHRDKINFFGPLRHISAVDLVALMDDLMVRSSFVSLYSALSYEDYYGRSAEDFAESFGFYVLSQMPEAQYRIKMGNGKVYDVLEKLKRPQMAEKMALVKRIYDLMPE